MKQLTNETIEYVESLRSAIDLKPGYWTRVHNDYIDLIEENLEKRMIKKVVYKEPLFMECPSCQKILNK